MYEKALPDRHFSLRALFLVAAATLTCMSCAHAQDTQPVASAPQASATDIQMTPDQAQTAIRLARAAKQAGDLNGAVSLYKALSAAQPDDTHMALEYGDTLNDAGYIDDAIGVYSKIGAESKDRVGALLGLERAYLRLGEADKALPYAEQAVNAAPQDADAAIGHGVALDMLNRHDEAQKCYRAVLDVSPRNVAARNDLALSLALTGDFAKAIDILTPIARSADASPRERQNLALIYGLQGNRDAAKALSSADLDAGDTDANLRFFESVRAAK